MTTPILSDNDIDCILRAADESKADRKRYAHTLYTKLLDIARAVNLKKWFWEAIYHGRSTRFVLTQLPLHCRLNQSMSISVEDVINEQMVLDRFEKSCGNYVQATYEVKDGYHIDVYLEFVPPTKSILNPEDVTIPTANEELQARRLEKETCW